MIRSPGPASGETEKPPRACQNCAKAKAKCVHPTEGGPELSCARCLRLKKECVVLPRSLRKRRSPTTKVNIGHLEQRIESLVNILSAGGGVVTQPNQNHLTPPFILDKLRDSSNPETISVLQQEDLPSDGEANLDFYQEMPKFSAAVRRRQFGFSQGTSENSGKEPLLVVFRDKYEHLLPFSFIPPRITSHELRVQKPWLHRTICMVAMYEEPSAQVDQAEDIILGISQEMLVKGTKNLDMLQGLIIHNAWAFHYSRLNPSKQSSAGFQLAIAMLHDLGLTKAARELEGPPTLLAEAMSKEVPESSTIERRSTEERRTLLACYLTASTYSLCIRKIDSMQYSPYMEYSCERLLAMSDSESDILLVSMIKLQAKLEAFYRSLPINYKSEDLQAPIFLHHKAVQVDFDNYWRSLAPPLRDNFFMILHYRTAEILLHEPSLQKTLFSTDSSKASSSPRLDILYAALMCCEKALDHLLTLRLENYARLPLLQIAHMGHSLSTLVKLSLVEEIGWDLVYVRQRVNVVTYLESFISKMKQAGAELDEHHKSPRRSLPSMSSNAMKKVKDWYETKIVESDPNFQSSARIATDFPLDMGFFGDDSYWKDFIGDFDDFGSL